MWELRTNALRKVISANSYAKIEGQTCFLRRRKICLRIDWKLSKMDKQSAGIMMTIITIIMMSSMIIAMMIILDDHLGKGIFFITKSRKENFVI